MKGYDDVLADLAAVLDQQPDIAGSLTLCGLVRLRLGQAAALMDPSLAAEGRRFTIVS